MAKYFNNRKGVRDKGGGKKWGERGVGEGGRAQDSTVRGRKKEVERGTGTSHPLGEEIQLFTTHYHTSKGRITSNLAAETTERVGRKHNATQCLNTKPRAYPRFRNSTEVGQSRVSPLGLRKLPLVRMKGV